VEKHRSADELVICDDAPRALWANDMAVKLYIILIGSALYFTQFNGV